MRRGARTAPFAAAVVAGALVLAANALDAAATCQTYALVHGTQCEASSLRTLKDLLSSRKLLLVVRDADLIVDLQCERVIEHKTIGPVSVPNLVVRKTIKFATRHGGARTADFGEREPVLDQFLEANAATIRIEPAANTTYRVLKPVADQGIYSGTTEISCLTSGDDVAVTAGELTYSRTDARAGLLRVSAARELFYRIEARPDTWPRKLQVWLCLALAASDCQQPSGDAGGTPPQVLAGQLSSKRLAPRITITGVPRGEAPEQTAAPTFGTPWTHEWQLDTDLARVVDLRFGIDHTDLPLPIKMPLPFWAPLVEHVPEPYRRIFLENYPQSLGFGVFMIALVLVVIVVGPKLLRKLLSKMAKKRP